MPKKPTESVSRPPAYDLPPPNAGLPFRGGLCGLCLPAADDGRPPPWAFASPAYETWLAPDLLEAALDADPKLQAALAAALDRVDGPGPRDWTAMERQVARVFEETVLVDICARFAALQPLVTRYALAKAAARRARPGRFPAPDGG